MQERAEKAEDRTRAELAAAKSAQQQAETRMNDLNTQLQLSLVAVSAARYWCPSLHYWYKSTNTDA